MAGLDDTSDLQPYHKMMYYIMGWIEKHMDPDCVEHATGSEQGRPALHFMNTELIQGRHFCLQLLKEPLTKILKKCSATWLSHLDAEIRELGVHSFKVINVEEDGVILYRIILKTIKDVPGVLTYLFSLRITRI